MSPKTRRETEVAADMLLHNTHIWGDCEKSCHDLDKLRLGMAIVRKVIQAEREDSS